MNRPSVGVKLQELYYKAQTIDGTRSVLLQIAEIAAHLTLIGVQHAEVSWDATCVRQGLEDIEKEFAAMEDPVEPGGLEMAMEDFVVEQIKLLADKY